MERDREKTIFERNARKKDHLKLMITRRKRVVFRMLNGDEEEFQPRPPKKPRLKLVK